jgi:hypothetical protein
MAGGEKDLEMALSDDPEMREVIEKLNALLRGSLM